MIDKERFYSPNEIVELNIDKLLDSRFKVLTSCDDEKTKPHLKHKKKGRNTLIKGEWIIEFLNKSI